MKAGYLSEFFTGVAAKTLSAVEADTSRSHQHELNGATELLKLFGKATGKHRYEALFIYLSDSDDEPVVDNGSLTWYDARANHPRRTEHRAYFPTNQVTTIAAAGDLLVVARRPDDTLLILVAQGESTIASQVSWLFGISGEYKGFSVREELETEQDRIEFASAFILEQFGIVAEAPSAKTYLDAMLERFGTIPPAEAFSAYARETLPDLDPRADPDTALLGWMEREEILFRTFEKHELGDRLQKGFAEEAVGFRQFSTAIQNRRKLHSGLALHNHLEVVFSANEVRHERNSITEGSVKSDFLFPGFREYRDLTYDPSCLTVLGAEIACRDRWRQILTTSRRVKQKHLLTLESAISRHRTDEMAQNMLQLVIPRGLHQTFAREQRRALLSVSDFLSMVKKRDRRVWQTNLFGNP